MYQKNLTLSAQKPKIENGMALGNVFPFRVKIMFVFYQLLIKASFSYIIYDWNFACECGLQNRINLKVRSER